MKKATPPSSSTLLRQWNKRFSAPALLKRIRADFGKVTDPRSGRQEFSLPAVLMSGLAVFGLKYPSLLKFDEQRHDARIRANLRSLYGVVQAPCDSQRRTVLDRVAPGEWRAPFILIHNRWQSQGVLEEYRYVGGFLIDVDGTGKLSSSRVSGKECCEKPHRHGEVEYYHQLLGALIVHPDQNRVLPLFPEAITKPDGQTKNDCESNASQRLLRAVREAFPKRPLIAVEDRLFADGPHIKLWKELDYHYIMVAKSSDLPAMFEEVIRRLNRGDYEEYEAVGKDGICRGYRWMTKVPLNQSHPDIFVNHLDYWAIRDGEEHQVGWLTDLELTRATVHPVMRAGRGRWKIENETFNTLKRQGYALEHNYGHGQKH